MTKMTPPFSLYHPSTIPTPPTYPARPLNGGPWPKAAPKPGVWYYEPKYNGWRTLVHIPTGAMFNRYGKLLIIDTDFLPALAMLRSTLDAEAFKWADCEALERRHNIGKGTLIVLDVIPEGKFIEVDNGERTLTQRQPTYTERRDWLESVLPISDFGRAPANNSLLLPPNDLIPDAAWQDLQFCNRNAGCEFYEGLVAKRADAPYPIQLRSPEEESTSLIKHRWKF